MKGSVLLLMIITRMRFRFPSNTESSSVIIISLSEKGNPCLCDGTGWDSDRMLDGKMPNIEGLLFCFVPSSRTQWIESLYWSDEK